MTYVRIKGKNNIDLMEIDDEGKVKITEEMAKMTNKKNMEQYLKFEKVENLDSAEVSITRDIKEELEDSDLEE